MGEISPTKEYGSNNFFFLSMSMDQTECYSLNLKPQSHRVSNPFHPTVTMPSNKLISQNNRFLARTEKSISVERDFLSSTKKESYNKETRANEYEKVMTAKSNDYALFWINEKGDRAKRLIEAYFCKESMKDPCFINVYNKETRKMEKQTFPDVLKMVFDDTEKSGNRLGQTRIWGDLYLSTEICKFMDRHWEYLKCGDSVC